MNKQYASCASMNRVAAKLIRFLLRLRYVILFNAFAIVLLGGETFHSPKFQSVDHLTSVARRQYYKKKKNNHQGSWARKYVKNMERSQQVDMYNAGVMRLNEVSVPDLKFYIYDLPHQMLQDLIDVNLYDPPKSLEKTQADCLSNFYSLEYWWSKWVNNYPQLLTSDRDKADYLLVPAIPVCFRNSLLDEGELLRGANGRRLTSQYLQNVLQEINRQDERVGWNIGKSIGRGHVSPSRLWVFTQGFGARMLGDMFWKNIRNTSTFMVSNGDREEEWYDEGKDIAIPSFQHLQGMTHGLPHIFITHRRPISVLFAGSIDPGPGGAPRVYAGLHYSKGVRQYIWKHFRDRKDWKIVSGHYPEYTSDLSKSTFCLCPEGWHAWTPRIYEALVSGCIPVIFAKSLDLPFSSFVEYDAFSVRINDTSSNSLRQLPDLLGRITFEEIVKRRQSMIRARNWFIFDLESPFKKSKNGFLGVLRALWERRQTSYLNLLAEADD